MNNIDDKRGDHACKGLHLRQARLILTWQNVCTYRYAFTCTPALCHCMYRYRMCFPVSQPVHVYIRIYVHIYFLEKCPNVVQSQSMILWAFASLQKQFYQYLYIYNICIYTVCGDVSVYSMHMCTSTHTQTHTSLLLPPCPWLNVKQHPRIQLSVASQLAGK